MIGEMIRNGTLFQIKEGDNLETAISKLKNIEITLDKDTELTTILALNNNLRIFFYNNLPVARMYFDTYNLSVRKLKFSSTREVISCLRSRSDVRAFEKKNNHKSSTLFLSTGSDMLLKKEGNHVIIDYVARSFV